MTTLTSVRVAEDKVVEDATGNRCRNVRQCSDRGVGSTGRRSAPEGEHSETATHVTCRIGCDGRRTEAPDHDPAVQSP